MSKYLSFIVLFNTGLIHIVVLLEIRHRKEKKIENINQLLKCESHLEGVYYSLISLVLLNIAVYNNHFDFIFK